MSKFVSSPSSHKGDQIQEKGLTRSKIFEMNIFPKRMALSFEVPTIILEYLVPNTGKLYHHKIKIRELKKNSNKEKVLEQIKQRHGMYLAKIPDQQILKLLQVLQEKVEVCDDKKKNQESQQQKQIPKAKSAIQRKLTGSTLSSQENELLSQFRNQFEDEDDDLTEPTQIMKGKQKEENNEKLTKNGKEIQKQKQEVGTTKINHPQSTPQNQEPKIEVLLKREQNVKHLQHQIQEDERDQIDMNSKRNGEEKNNKIQLNNYLKQNKEEEQLQEGEEEDEGQDENEFDGDFSLEKENYDEEEEEEDDDGEEEDIYKKVKKQLSQIQQKEASVVPSYIPQIEKKKNKLQMLEKQALNQFDQFQKNQDISGLVYRDNDQTLQQEQKEKSHSQKEGGEEEEYDDLQQQEGAAEDNNSNGEEYDDQQQEGAEEYNNQNEEYDDYNDGCGEEGEEGYEEYEEEYTDQEGEEYTEEVDCNNNEKLGNNEREQIRNLNYQQQQINKQLAASGLNEPYDFNLSGDFNGDDNNSNISNPNREEGQEEGDSFDYDIV